MAEEIGVTVDPRHLQDAIERQILLRTWGSVQRLQVEVVGNRVIIDGHAPSYYVKQLAIQGVLDVLGHSSSTIIEVHIQVGAAAAD